MAAPIVEVEQGKLQGKSRDSFFSFKGIPYAKPPVGDLRFSAPVPPEPWNGVRDATKDCNICAQFDLTTNTIVGNEDCLYLNVSTPKLPPGKLLPVMVFIHGGGFMFGNGTNESEQGPDFLVKKNVVLVAFNYRVGAFGFACLDTKEVTGNMGLRDQVQALKWVQKNISKFGGDPANVTIFGISAGGASVQYLMISPMAKDLFHKAIAQSGSTLLPWGQSNEVKELTKKLPTVLGIEVNNDTELLKCLKGMSTKDLAQSSVALMMQTKHQGGLYFAFVPTVEKTSDWEAFLDKSPYSIISKGEFNQVPFITGVCNREAIMLPNSPFDAPFKQLLKERNYLEFVDEFFGIDDSKVEDISQKFTKIYEEVNKYDEPDSSAIDFFSDVDFIGGIYTSTVWIAKYNPDTYFYDFAYDGNLNYLKVKFGIKRKDACHGDDTAYLFKSDIHDSAAVTETDKLILDRITEMWTNFSKYGVPTRGVNSIIPTSWEPFGADKNYLVIDENLSLKQDPYPERTHLFKSLYDTFHSKK